MASSSSSSFPRWEWDVFLSFRGEDTRLNFTDHLYGALNKSGIRTFRDEEKLERGKHISPELLKAIEESRFAVIILSRNYASSKWCLDELAKIVDCMKEKKLTVVPVFYDVDPSDVRNQRGSFAQVFSQHEERFKENKKKVQRWRDALREVANVSGWHLQDRHESEVIQEIVGEILRQSDSRIPIVSDELFGIESRVEKLMNTYLGVGVLDDVRFVGIWGMPGIGKTTLARAVYGRIAREFEAYCFLSNVREEAGKRGLVALQKQLLSETIHLVESSTNIWDVYKGAGVIRDRLRRKRVLIILDDVDKTEQLRALAEERSWFGGGSRIIITTGDKRVLIEHDVDEDEIYEARELNYNEALQLFSRKAFKEDRPPKDFVELSKKVLSHAKGLPLALDIWGSPLYRTSVGVWESMLSKLKEIPEENILDKLKISFDGLPELQKKIFLDIACFFKGEDKDRVEDILESCGYHPILGIDNLINKSLITISGKKLWMHDLLEAMGREIVRREYSSNERGSRSRLWSSEDIFPVLKTNTGTDKVEGIVLNSAVQEEVDLNAEVFSKMPNLRLLKIHNVRLSQGLSNLPNELRVMDWHGYPLKKLPEYFSPDKLVELIMPCSHIKQIWTGKKRLPKLKILDLSDSRNLIEVPDLSDAPNLKKLNLKDCKSLTSLPGNISSYSLKILILSGCSKLDKMPENLGNMESLEELDASRTAIIHVPSSILQLTNLQYLCFRGCKGPLSTWLFFIRCLIPSPDIGLVLPTSFLGLRNLTTLDLSYCDLLDGAIPDDLSSLSSLKFLDLSGNKFEHIPESISQLSKLTLIFLNECSSLQSLPKFPSSVVYVSAADCTSLETQSRETYAHISDETGVSVITCLISNQCNDRVSGKLKLSCAQRNLMRRRHIEAAIDLGEEISGTSLRAGIPRWFNNQNSDSPASIQLHLDSNDRSNWLGYALYFIFEVHEDEIFEYESKDEDQFFFSFDTDEGPLKQPLFRSVGKVHDGWSRGFWLYVPRLWFAEMSNNVDKWSFIEASITSTSPNMVVKMSGARLVLNEQNAQEFVETLEPLYMKTFNICGGKRQFKGWISPKDDYTVSHFKSRSSLDGVKCSGSKLLENSLTSLDKISHEIQECESKYFRFSTPSQIPVEHQGCKSDSAIRLTTKLQSLLLRCYEVNYAQNKMFKYIFPLSESPLWFRNHGTGPIHNINLPPNLYDNKRWMGFALYARYAINDQATASCDNLHSTISRNFFGLLDTDDHHDLECFMVFPLSRDVFVESHRLLLFYVPRVFFTDKLNQRSCIRAAFGSFSPGVEVEMCGITVLMQEELEELVQTIAGCILRSPDKYHQGYLRILQDQANRLLSYVPEAISSTECNPLEGEEPIPFGLCTSMQRRIQFLEKVPSSIEHGAEKNSNVFEKYLSQVTARRASRDSNSNVIQAGAMYFNVFCRTGLVSRALHSLLLKYFQDYYYQHYPYNDCFPQSEIPKYFCCHDGPAINLPPNLFNNSDWIGIALCAAFTVHKIPSLIHDNPDSEIYHSLSCYLSSGTDFYMTTNFHMITASEYNRFIWLNNRRFIWLSYIPRGSFSDSLNKCKRMLAYFESNSQDLEVQKCGHRFVYKKVIPDFVETIVQCATTRPHNFRVTNQFEGDENRNNKQGHVDEGETSGTPLCIDYLKTRKWTNFLQKHCEEYHLLFEYDCIFPPSEIPELFSHRGNGPSVTIKLPSNLHNDSTWIGFAVCASFSVHEYPTEFFDSLESEIPHHLICHFETDAGSSKPIHVYRTTREEFKWLHLRGFIWLCCIPYWYLWDGMNHCDHIEVSIVSDWPGWTVQECGLRLMYQQDEQEMRQIVLHCSVSFLDNWDLIRRDVAEQDLAENQGYKCELTTLLKRKLESLFLTIYNLQGHKIEYDPILFPQDSMPLWFGHQSNGPSIEIQLPTNLYNDETWKGFAICAVLDFSSNSSGNTDSRTSTYIILHLDSNEGCLEPNLVIPLPSSAFGESHQLVVEHVSPMMLPTKLNQWSHIRATVECNGPGVEIVMCGMHIMYKQDVEGFVQTMVECASAIPEAKRVDYYRSLVNRAHFVQSRGNRAESNYPCFSPTSESCRRFQSPRRPPLSNKHKVEPESITSSNEGFPERTSGNYVEPTLPPTSLDCKSDSFFQLKRDLEYLLQNNFKALCPCHATDIVLPHTDIPEWFNHQSRGPSVTIQLPPNLYDDSDWMGLALCAAVSVLKHPTLIRRNLDSGVSHQLACLWDTDIGCVEPPHVFEITEEKFTWLYLRGFIWVSYIPRKLWSEDLNLCSSIKATIAQSLKEIEKATVGHLHEEKKNGNSWMPFPLIAEKCGLRLVYQKDMQELQETIIKCVTSPFDNNVEYIHQLIADESRITEQTTEAGCSYRDPFPERLRTPIYQGQNSGSGISFEGQPHENQFRRSLPVFDRCSVYNSCFPPIKIPEWFSDHSNGDLVTVPLSPSFHNDSGWVGLVLCASLSIYEHSAPILENLERETSHNLTCCLLTDIDGIDRTHVYRPTRGDVKLLHLGGFTWLSYIPRRSLPDWLNQCRLIGALFSSDSPSLKVQNCGLGLVFRHNEVRFKEVIRHCIASLSGSSSEDADPERLGGSFDHRLKDKGKRVVE